MQKNIQLYLKKTVKLRFKTVYSIQKSFSQQDGCHSCPVDTTLYFYLFRFCNSKTWGGATAPTPNFNKPLVKNNQATPTFFCTCAEGTCFGRHLSPRIISSPEGNRPVSISVSKNNPELFSLPSTTSNDISPWS